jgi:hypothetical protein
MLYININSPESPNTSPEYIGKASFDRWMVQALNAADQTERFRCYQQSELQLAHRGFVV